MWSMISRFAVELHYFGLLLNLAGTPMLAFAFGNNPGKAHIIDDWGRVTYLASLLRPKLFWFGLIVMGIGYALQLAAASCQLVAVCHSQ